MPAQILLPFVFVLATAHAKQAAIVGSFDLPPSGSYFGAGPFRNQLPTFALTPKSPGARHGNLWIRNTNNGLLLVGKVDGPDPQWSIERHDLLGKDHIEVWIAGAPNLRLPPIDWAGLELNSADDCPTAAGGGPSTPAHNEVSECQSWYSQQITYRPQLKRLFVRQFVFTHQRTVEEFATSAYEKLASTFFSDYVPVPLEPKLTSSPRMLTNIGAGFRFAYPNETGYEFQISLPYEAFPPLRQLTVQDLWIMVNVFNSAGPGQNEGPYATSAPEGEWGNPSTFNHVQFEHPRRFTLSPCDVELSEEGENGEDRNAWFFPESQDTIDRDFILQNYAAVFRDWGAKPSPIIHTVDHFWKELPGGYVCGPDLTYKKGKANRTQTKISAKPASMSKRFLMVGF